MKKIFIMAFILVFTASWAMAAGTVTGSDKKIGENYREITYTVTFVAAASPANVALDSILTSGGLPLTSVGGWWIFRVDTVYGTVGPTDDTDFYLWYVEDKIDVLGGNGVDKIDNATNNSIYPATSTQPLSGAEIFDVDNNLVETAGTATTVIFRLYR